MIISDLNYLETVTETSSVVGGTSKKHDKKKSYYPSTAVAVNSNYTEQNAAAIAAGKGPNTAVAINQNATFQDAFAFAGKKH